MCENFYGKSKGCEKFHHFPENTPTGYPNLKKTGSPFLGRVGENVSFLFYFCLCSESILRSVGEIFKSVTEWAHL